MYLFNLIRWKNLVFLFLTLFLMQTSVVNPILLTFGFDSLLSDLEFALMLLAVLFLAAGGYVINDYFDVKIDEINKPEQRIVGRMIDRHRAIVIHQVLTAIGVCAGLYLAFLLRSITVGAIYVLIPGLLWFYSASYKRQFFIGNIIVAFNVACSILLVALINVSKLRLCYGDLLFETPILRNIYMWIGGFTLFAFLFTICREIIKDIEDEEGDREMECYTLPIKLGLAKTKYVLYGVLVVMILLLCYVSYSLIPFVGDLSSQYILWGLCVPMLVLGILIMMGKTKRDFAQASQLAKYIMLVGVLYSVVFYYLMAKTFGILFFGVFSVV